MQSVLASVPVCCMAKGLLLVYLPLSLPYCARVNDFKTLPSLSTFWSACDCSNAGVLIPFWRSWFESTLSGLPKLLVSF